MGYKDTWATCDECGRQFVFRVEEQRALEQAGEPIAPPARCPDCRGEAPRGAPAGADSRPDRGARGTGRERGGRSERGGPSDQGGRGERDSRSARTGEERPERQLLSHGPHEGHVKWYSRDKGFGFIAHPSGQEVFFHRSGIAAGQGEGFPDGTRVRFVVEETEKGQQAAEVTRVEEGDED